MKHSSCSFVSPIVWERAPSIADAQGMRVDYIHTDFAFLAWSAKTHATFFALKILLQVQSQSWWKEEHLPGGVRMEGIWTALGTSFPIPDIFSHVQSGGWSQLSYLPMTPTSLTWLTGNIPSVCPVEFTVNPVYSKTFGSIYCFLNEPFSLGTIHIGSLYPLQDCMGKVYLQKRTWTIFIRFKK